MYPQEFSDFKNEFLNDPEVANLVSTIKQRFEDGYKKHILEKLDKEEIYDGLDVIYSLMRDDNNPEDYTIFDILLINTGDPSQ
jgi:hypothetical protein